MKKFTKEQLENTYIVNDCPVKYKAYVDACDNAGIEKSPAFPCDGEGGFLAIPEYSHGALWLLTPKSSVSGLTKLHLSDLIELENSKVYTTDQGVVRKYAELCGNKSPCKLGKWDGEIIGVSNNNECGFDWFSSISMVNKKGECSCGEVHEITVDQVNALHREKFPEQYEPKPKPRTRVEYVKVDMDTNDIAKAMIDGEVFYNEDGSKHVIWDGMQFQSSNGKQCNLIGPYYRRVEKEVDWRDEIESFVQSCNYLGCYTEIQEAFTKPSNDMEFQFDNEFLEMCRVALRATGELPE